jgi:type I restriction enzyme, S subunit
VSEAPRSTLPPNWISVNLSQLAAINPPLDRCLVSDDVPVDFVPMRSVEPEGGGLLRPEVASYGKVRKGYTAFLCGDVIMAKITPCMENGKTCVVPSLPGAACFGSTEFHVLRAEPGIEARWIANYLLQRSTRYTAQRQMAGGVGQMRVPASFLETLAVPVPPEPEQIRILDTLDELLSDLDAGVATLERVRTKLNHFRSAMLKAAVEGALTAEWRRQHPATESADVLLTSILAERRRLWEEAQLAKFSAAGKAPPKGWKGRYREPIEPPVAELSQLPTSWCWASLDQLSSFITSGSRGWGNYYSNDGPLFVRSQDIRTDRLVLADVAHVTPPETSEGERTRLCRGDLLVTITGANVAKAALVDFDVEEAYVSQHVGMTRFVEPSVGKFVHAFAIASSGGRKVLLKMAYGAGKPGLNLDNLRGLLIPLPPIDEQAKVVEAMEDQLSVIDHVERNLESHLSSVHALRQSILRHAFNGRLVPQDPNDKHASELLKRIGAEREERARMVRAAKRAKPKTKSPRRRATQD